MSPVSGRMKPVVVAAVLAVDSSDVSETINRIRDQVYETTRIVVVGAGGHGRQAADAAGVEWMTNVPNLLGSIDTGITHVWFVYAGALPRPDALEALVHEAERTDAAVAGSKIVQFDDPERLIAVGIATDVFDVPYLGLEDDGETVAWVKVIDESRSDEDGAAVVPDTAVTLINFDRVDEEAGLVYGRGGDVYRLAAGWEWSGRFRPDSGHPVFTTFDFATGLVTHLGPAAFEG